MSAASPAPAKDPFAKDPLVRLVNHMTLAWTISLFIAFVLTVLWAIGADKGLIMILTALAWLYTWAHPLRAAVACGYGLDGRESRRLLADIWYWGGLSIGNLFRAIYVIGCLFISQGLYLSAMLHSYYDEPAPFAPKTEIAQPAQPESRSLPSEPEAASAELEKEPVEPKRMLWELRTWTDFKGRTINARLVYHEVHSGTAGLMRPDGTEMRMGLGLLSPRDRAYVRDHTVEPPMLRTWVDAKGRTIEAGLLYVDMSAQAVRLFSPDGKEADVALSDLSPKDREYALGIGKTGIPGEALELKCLDCGKLSSCRQQMTRTRVGAREGFSGACPHCGGGKGREVKSVRQVMVPSPSD